MPHGRLSTIDKPASADRTGKGIPVDRPSGDAAAATDLIEAALDCLPIGIIMVDDMGAALHLNTSARAIVASGHGLTVCNGILKGVTPSATRALHTLIRQASHASLSPIARDGASAMPLSDPDASRPLSITVAPFRRRAKSLNRRRPAAIVFIGDPMLETEISNEMLAVHYGLTQAEAALAVALLPGHGLKSAALATGMNMNTAKTHLKRVFDKTGTCRQAELVRLVSSGPAGLRFD